MAFGTQNYRANAAGSRLPNTQMQPQQQQYGSIGPVGTQGMGGTMNMAARNRPAGRMMGGGPNQNYAQQIRGLGPTMAGNYGMQKPPMPSSGYPTAPLPEAQYKGPSAWEGSKGPYVDPMKQQYDTWLNGGGGENPYALAAHYGENRAMPAVPNYGRPDVMPRTGEGPRGIGPSSPYEAMLGAGNPQERISVNSFAGQPNQYGMRPV